MKTFKFLFLLSGFLLGQQVVIHAAKPMDGEQAAAKGDVSATPKLGTRRLLSRSIASKVAIASAPDQKKSAVDLKQADFNVPRPPSLTYHEVVILMDQLTISQASSPKTSANHHANALCRLIKKQQITDLKLYLAAMQREKIDTVIFIQNGLLEGIKIAAVSNNPVSHNVEIIQLLCSYVDILKASPDDVKAVANYLLGKQKYSLCLLVLHKFRAMAEDLEIAGNDEAMYWMLVIDPIIATLPKT